MLTELKIQKSAKKLDAGVSSGKTCQRGLWDLIGNSLVCFTLSQTSVTVDLNQIKSIKMNGKRDFIQFVFPSVAVRCRPWWLIFCSCYSRSERRLLHDPKHLIRPMIGRAFPNAFLSGRLVCVLPARTGIET